MHSPTASEIAGAFGLGEPAGELVLVRRGDTDTWRLETDGGSYFVKGYRAETGGQFVAGGLIDQLRVAMSAISSSSSSNTSWCRSGTIRPRAG